MFVCVCEREGASSRHCCKDLLRFAQICIAKTTNSPIAFNQGPRTAAAAPATAAVTRDNTAEIMAGFLVVMGVNVMLLGSAIYLMFFVDPDRCVDYQFNCGELSVA